jgi:hypothetical protein
MTGPRDTALPVLFAFGVAVLAALALGFIGWQIVEKLRGLAL